jgi:hypothetical protein
VPNVGWTLLGIPKDKTIILPTQVRAFFDRRKELLAGSKPRKVFNTRRFVQTYRSVWNLTEDSLLPYADDLGLTSEGIATAINQMQPQWFFDINQLVLSDIGFFMDEEVDDFQEEKFINLFTKDLPVLRIPPTMLGIRINRS